MRGPCCQSCADDRAWGYTDPFPGPWPLCCCRHWREAGCPSE